MNGLSCAPLRVTSFTDMNGFHMSCFNKVPSYPQFHDVFPFFFKKFIYLKYFFKHTHTHIHTSFFHLLVYPKKAAKLKWSMSGLGWRREPGPLFMSPSWVAGALMFRPVFCFPDVNRGWIRSGMSIQDLNWCSCGILVSKVVAQLLHHNDDSDVYSFQK